MSPRPGFEADGGSAASARKTTNDAQREAPLLAVKPANGARAKSALPIERIGRLTEAELAELSPRPKRGVTSGAFAKRGSETTPDWSALKQPVPVPPPPAAGEVTVPSAVKPIYNKLPSAPERAELHVHEISLDMANPFLGSSLLPPPPKKRPWLKPSLIALGCMGLLGAGYAGAVYHVERAAIAKVQEWSGNKVAVAPAKPADDAAQRPTRVIGAVEAPHTAAPIETLLVEVKPVEAEPAVNAAPVEQPFARSPAAVAAAGELRAASVKPGRPVRGRRSAVRAIPVSAKVTIKARARSDEKAAHAEPDLSEAALSAPMTNAAPTAEARERPAPAPENLSKELTRDEVQNGLEGMRRELETCAAGEHGRMVANVTISGAGRVTYATIEGAFAGTPQGSCMARALRGARFPQVASPQLRVRYPFAL